MFCDFFERLKSQPITGRLAEAARTNAKPAGVALLATAVVGGLIWTSPGPQIWTLSAEGGAQSATPVIVAKPPVIRKPMQAAAKRVTPRPSALGPVGVNVATASAQKLFTDFRRIGYRLEDLRKGAGDVPRVFVKTMPQDIGLVRSIRTRKAVFIKTMLPLILSINESLRATRARVLDLIRQTEGGRELNEADRAWLATQYDHFGVAPGQTDLLLRRIDVIPPSLAVAQGAEESGWGSSRFAREGRALFGQRTFKGRPGIVPLERGEGERFMVRTFDHLLDGVRSYVHNLNTHPAYAQFRMLRSKMRSDAGGMHGIDSLKLVDALKSYSERGAAYVKTIKSIIGFNGLRDLDDDRLEQAGRGNETTGPV